MRLHCNYIMRAYIIIYILDKGCIYAVLMSANYVNNSVKMVAISVEIFSKAILP